MKKIFIAVVFVFFLGLFGSQTQVQAEVSGEEYLELKDKIYDSQEKVWPFLFKYLEPEYHLDNPFTDNMSEEQYEELRNVALEATANCKSDYERIYCITYFVAQTIYYDDYSVAHGLNVPFTPYNVFHSARAQCSGYAALMKTFLNSIDIPCIYFSSGHVLSDEEGHAYNVAYDREESRWIVLDATFCSRNRIKPDGTTVTGEFWEKYFDYDPTAIIDDFRVISGCNGLLDKKENVIYQLVLNEGDWTPETWELRISKSWNNKEPKKKIICDGIAGLKVTGMRGSAFRDDTNVEKIDLSKTFFTSISTYAFSGCSKLKKVIFPDNVTEIGNDAFSMCTSLKSIDLSKTKLKKLEMSLFSGCTNLKEVVFPKKLKEIDAFCFQDCTSLTTVDLSKLKELKKLEFDAFSGCRSLITINFPDKEFELGLGKTEGLVSLKSLDLSRTSLTKIDKSMIGSCNSLESIKLPETLKEIGNDAFYNCTRLKEITFPKSLKVIGRNAFENCVSLQKVDLSKTKVTEIKEKAFRYCMGLKEIYFPQTLTTLGDWTFELCGGLELVVWSKKLKNFGWFPFDAYYTSDEIEDDDLRNEENERPIYVVTRLAEKDLYSSDTIWARRKPVVVPWMYQIKFDGMGATGGKMANMTCMANQNYSLKKNSFSKKGYTFTGWNTKPDGSGKTYKNLSKVKNLSKKNMTTVTLYAQWKKVK